MSFKLDDFLPFTFQPSDALINGLIITLYAAVIAQVLGVGLGIVAALGGRSRNPIINTISGFYVWIFRGTPVLVQILLESHRQGNQQPVERNPVSRPAPPGLVGSQGENVTAAALDFRLQEKPHPGEGT